jgi:uncharacterized protein YjbJ (UPF0337 family)
MMDKNRVKGAVDEVVGSAKRHVGKWTGNIKTEAEGAVQQVKGNVETAIGELKDAARDVRNEASDLREEKKLEHTETEALPIPEEVLMPGAKSAKKPRACCKK